MDDPESPTNRPAPARPRQPKQPSKRQFATVDLGDLRARVDAAAAAAGLGPSTWLKDLVRREVGELSVDQAPVVERGAERGDPVYRAALDADLVAKLDERVKSDGLRDRAAGLRALIEGAVVLPQSGDVSLRDAVQVLAQSNENLAALWLSVTKEAHTIAGSASSGDRRALRTAAAEIRRHIDVAVQLVGQLRPLLKRPAR